MPTVHDEIRAAGIELVAHGAHPELWAECARLARLLRERHVHTIGLAPAGADVAIPAVAIELGRAIAESGALVGVLDGLGTWPCARALIERAGPGSVPLATTRLLEGVALLTPYGSDARSSVAHLQSALLQAEGGFTHLVVDLTGFGQLGEELAACEILDGVVLVARSGRTTVRQIQRWLRDHAGLGVLLTGL